MQIPFLVLIPFVIQLLFIAIGPLVINNWWENNLNKLIVSIVLSSPIVLFLAYNNMLVAIEHQIFFDYIPFITLLTALFATTGGIHLSGRIQATAKTNTTFLAIGYILASIMGTTGAAMLLIRPILMINKERKYKTHTVLFFIALVANCGGLLTPLGDPPLFLLYLRGAEFSWFLNLLPEWAFVGALLLTTYYFVDRYYLIKKENWVDIAVDMQNKVPLRLTGKINFIFIALILLSVAFINPQHITLMAEDNAPLYIKFLREIILLIIIIASMIATPKYLREMNKFTWHPITEVSAVFIGIFATMTPALMYLNQHSSSLGITTSTQFYYFTGMLSSLLDNAPTALAFHSLAQGLPIVGTKVADISELLLQAIATSSVFWGAITYIGNGPNFMVKSIAEENGISMPSFFEYMAKFSLIVLLPTYILCQILFL
ncbi:MAG: sodium:proton antiporter [Bacteroidales bacterium]|nr:MAG: sodium:proton antiporter [Bacteroidales bacterium]